jgi:hypothetical protein
LSCSSGGRAARKAGNKATSASRAIDRRKPRPRNSRSIKGADTSAPSPTNTMPIWSDEVRAYSPKKARGMRTTLAVAIPVAARAAHTTATCARQ